MQESRARLAAAASCPPERHLAFAAIMGTLVASQAAPVAGTFAIEALCFFSTGLVFLWDKRRTGMFINGYRRGRTRSLTFALLAVLLVIGGLGVWLKFDKGLWWAPIPAGLVVTLVSFVASRAWQQLYRAELQTMP
jgi:hypothetical protein